MSDTAMRRRKMAVLLAAFSLTWGAVLAVASPQPNSFFPVAETKR